MLKRGHGAIGCMILASIVLVLFSASCGRSGTSGSGAAGTSARGEGELREFEIVAAPTTLPLIDGRQLEVWAYNGQVPGPTLRVRVGDTVRVRFANHLPQPTTLHWHGIRLPNAMDGVPGVTQPPIALGGSFVYEFVVPDAGTFWFHPHVRASEQVERGLFGVLIVEDREPLPFFREVLWVLDDWLLGSDGQLVGDFNTRHDLAHDGRWGNWITVNGRARATETVAAGERIRLRMVNVANGRVFSPDLSAFDASVIAFDGLYTDRPLATGGLEIAPGNRVDVDLSVPVALAGREVEILDRFTRRASPIATANVVAEIQPTPVGRLAFRPASERWPDAASARPAFDFRLNARAGGPFGIEWMINETPFRHEAGDHGHPASYRLSLDQWAKLRFINESFRLHPMHLHGQFFYVVARNDQPVDEGHWRDTVLIHPHETVDVALKPRDVGLWMLHCHILEHAESGMMTLLQVSQQ
ncbi:MAG: multicopper oxidase family protein [Deltaproteobacteria bacterium]